MELVPANLTNYTTVRLAPFPVGIAVQCTNSFVVENTNNPDEICGLGDAIRTTILLQCDHTAIRGSGKSSLDRVGVPHAHKLQRLKLSSVNLKRVKNIPYLGASLHPVALVQYEPRVPPVPIDVRGSADIAKPSPLTPCMMGSWGLMTPRPIASGGNFPSRCVCCIPSSSCEPANNGRALISDALSSSSSSSSSTASSAADADDTAISGTPARCHRPRSSPERGECNDMPLISISLASGILLLPVPVSSTPVPGPFLPADVALNFRRSLPEAEVFGCCCWCCCCR
uniref:Uncharacterized protein n=1 Tax=Anopheles coluzzii TaxID=1518534 RepID=A0A8W7PP72_ANOCL